MRWSEAVKRNEKMALFHSRFPTRHHKNPRRSSKGSSGLLGSEPRSSASKNNHCLPVIGLIDEGYFGIGRSEYFYPNLSYVLILSSIQKGGGAMT
jgi:hypothetical protein